MNRMEPIEFAKHLRQSSNSYEDLMWQLLRNRQQCDKKFRRQHPLGIYTADFYCAEVKLVIEIDGADHLTPEGQAHDRARDAWMHSQGIRVLRFTGKQVDLETRCVLEHIELVLKTPSPPAPLPEAGRGEKDLVSHCDREEERAHQKFEAIDHQNDKDHL